MTAPGLGGLLRHVFSKGRRRPPGTKNAVRSRKTMRRRPSMVNRTTRALFVMAVLLAIPSAVMAQRWGRSPFPGSGACFFRGPEFRGEYFCLSAGEDLGRLPDEMNDQISSIRVFGRAEVIVFGGDRFRGGWARFDRS